MLPQQRCQLRRVFRDRCGRVSNDETAQPGSRRLIVRDQTTVVSNQGIRHQHDLTRIARVGADLLVARLTRVDHKVATGGDRCTPSNTWKDAPIFKGEECWSVIANARVNNGCRLWKWDEGATIRCQRSTWRVTHCVRSSPASRGHLRSLRIVSKGHQSPGEPGGIRTHDLVIKSHLLYR